jgi:hypothetical protein
MEPGSGERSDYAPEIAEKPDVQALSLRVASLARPTQSLIRTPHRVRMSHFWMNKTPKKYHMATDID